MCDPYVKEVFSQLFHSSLAEISNLALSAVLTSFIVIFTDWQKCGFSLNIPADLSLYLCLSLSHSVVPH